MSTILMVLHSGRLRPYPQTLDYALIIFEAQRYSNRLITLRARVRTHAGTRVRAAGIGREIFCKTNGLAYFLKGQLAAEKVL
jgi:hypothetical protein